jgi:hypothetical protein
VAATQQKRNEKDDDDTYRLGPDHRFALQERTDFRYWPTDLPLTAWSINLASQGGQ